MTHKNESIFNKFFENSAIGLILTDIHGEILETNNSLCNMIGKDKNNIIQKNIEEIIVDENEETFDINLSKLITETKKSLQFEIKIKTIESFMWVNMIIYVEIINDETFYLIEIIDINDKKKSQITLQENVHKYQQLLDATNAIYLILDEEGIIKEFSQTFVDIFNIKEKNSPNSNRPHRRMTDKYPCVNCSSLRAFISASTIIDYDSAWKKILKGYTITGVEMSISKNKICKWFNMNGSMLKNGESKIFLLLTDITEKKKTEIRKNIDEERKKDTIKNHIKNLRQTIQEHGEN